MKTKSILFLILFNFIAFAHAATGDTIIVDNENASGVTQSGGWTTSAWGSPYGTNAAYKASNDGSAWISFKPEFLKSGYYNVFETISDKAKGKWTKVLVISNEDTSLVRVDHGINEGQFNYVQSIYIDTAVNNEFIYFNSEYGGIKEETKVDAMQFVFIDSTIDNGNVTDTLILDSHDPYVSSRTGNWTSTDYTSYLYGRGFICSEEDGNDSVFYQFEAPRTGFYQLQMKHDGSENGGYRANDVPVIVTSASFTKEYSVDQTSGGNFDSIGTIYADSGVITTIIVTSEVSGISSKNSISADAFKLFYVGNSDIEAPAKVTGVMIDTISDTLAVIVWNHTTDNKAVTGYKLYDTETGIAMFTITDTFFVATGLDPFTTYSGYLVAIDEAGNESVSSDTLTFKTLDLVAPSTVTLSQNNVTQTSVTLSWTTATDDVGVLGYNVYQDDVKIAGIQDSTTLNIASLAPASSYDFFIEVLDSASNMAYSDTITVTTVTPDTVDAPSFSVAGGAFVDTVKLVLSTDTLGTSIYYTTDGTDPDMGSTLYSDTIKISATTTVKAIAYKTGLESSAIVTEVYTVDIPNSIVEAASKVVTVYPNPATDIIYISDASIVVIYNILGEKVFESGSSVTSVDVSGLSKGNYIISVNGSLSQIIIE